MVNALRVAKVRSSLHIGQYAGSVPSDHSQRQVLVEPLSLPTWGHLKCQRVSLRDCSRQRHTCRTHQWFQLQLVLFVSLLSLCHLCFCLMQRPFSVHAQLRHAITHHSACFLQQRFTASLLFSPATISTCIPQTTMCFSVTNSPFTFTFRLCFLFNQATLGLRPCPRFCLHSSHNLFFIVPFRSQLLCTMKKRL